MYSQRHPRSRDARIARTGVGPDGNGSQDPGGWAELLDLRRLVEHTYGLIYDGPDSGLLMQAIADRMQATRIADLRSYCSFVLAGAGGAAELRLLADAATVRETRFLRGAGLFEALSSEIIPDLVRRLQPASLGGRGLRAWSAGCSSGDEAYSLSLVLLESGRGRHFLPVKVIGTDISSSALAHAAGGVYSRSAVRNVDGNLLKRYLVELPAGEDEACRTGQGPGRVRYRVGPELAASVEFIEHSLTATPYSQYLRGFDLILCRNVLMYFSNDTALRVMYELSSSLREGGYLVLDPWVVPPAFEEPGFSSIRCAYGAVIRRLSRSRRQVRRSRNRVKTAPAGVPRPTQARIGRDRQPAGIEEPLSEDRIDQARAMADRGDFEQALLLLDALRQETPLDPRVHLLMGETHLQLSDPEAASYCFGRLIYLEPGNAVAYWRMADVYGQMGRHDDELRQLYSVLQCLEDPGSHEGLELPGDVLVKACLRRIERLRLRQRA